MMASIRGFHLRALALTNQSATCRSDKPVAAAKSSFSSLVGTGFGRCSVG
jgi:hypothetical protein